jgi:hypothetical protein
MEDPNLDASYPGAGTSSSPSPANHDEDGDLALFTVFVNPDHLRPRLIDAYAAYCRAAGYRFADTGLEEMWQSAAVWCAENGVQAEELVHIAFALFAPIPLPQDLISPRLRAALLDPDYIEAKNS